MRRATGKQMIQKDIRVKTLKYIFQSSSDCAFHMSLSYYISNQWRGWDTGLAVFFTEIDKLGAMQKVQKTECHVPKQRSPAQGMVTSTYHRLFHRQPQVTGGMYNGWPSIASFSECSPVPHSPKDTLELEAPMCQSFMTYNINTPSSVFPFKVKSTGDVFSTLNRGESPPAHPSPPFYVF